MRGLFLILLFSLNVNAQIAVGLRESALGNSGVAFTDSSAPSHYNPALLAERSKSYFSITGTSLSSFKSSTDAGEFNSTKFSPNYLSSIHAFESYIHEFSLVNQFSIDSRLTTAITDGTRNSHIRNDNYNLAYSFAFRDFPWGFQLGLRISEENNSISQATNDGNTAVGVDFDISRRLAHLYAGFGGVHQLSTNYRLGYKYETQGLKIYKQRNQSGRFYVYDKTGNTFTTGTPQSTDSDFNNYNMQVITIGHSFTVGDHEFLTDSRFTEDALIKNNYTYFQTFGYKVNFANKMQLMTGAAYEFESKSIYLSVGYSWLTNTLRSTISAYHVNNDEDGDDSKLMGITFGSEYVY